MKVKVTQDAVAKITAPNENGKRTTGSTDTDATASLVNASELARYLKTGEKLTISAKDGVIQAEKVGPDRYQAIKRDAGDAAGTTASALSLGINGSFGVDPTVSALGSVQAAYSTVSQFSLIPSEITNFFTSNFFPAFRLLAPILDSLKFMNTWKLSRAMAKAEAKDSNVKGWRKLFKSGSLGNVIVDGAHVVLDIAVAAAVVGAIIHFPALALIPKLAALGVGFGGDLAAAAFHGVGAAENLSNPSNGATFKERLQKFLHTQSWTALKRRVFKGEEPLMDKTADG